jgi:hypothetical protein
MADYRKRVFKSWPTLRSHYQDRPRSDWHGWAFRGMKSSEWVLTSSLERAVVDRFQFGWLKMESYETRTLRAFQRQAQNHINPVPPIDDRIQWAALMQHHGAPTRLLDWTYSFYVAAYFAIEDAAPDDECAVWAINTGWLNKRLKQMYPDCRAKDSHAHLWSKSPRPGIFPANPFVLNQRLTLQQGCFMAVGDVSEDFGSNYQHMDPPATKAPLEKWTLRSDKSNLRNAFADLHRMNVSRATLFPGLDGFARSLNALLPWSSN